jgi:hypothetical protein
MSETNLYNQLVQSHQSGKLTGQVLTDLGVKACWLFTEGGSPGMPNHIFQVISQCGWQSPQSSPESAKASFVQHIVTNHQQA